ncbi:hypothetical protein DSM14862_01961 [Sulfitobacter indolifex]|uniref:Antibiotic resistance protein n=1 Tax=Sulfitobacter indolifex HEL-45 TaxID=391624 RepID=A0ABP2D8P0_9RHOB|nr:TfuA-like protein [Sulfitobacter indolifex]EDQ04321.1 putative antibiotic resistance protein [Sulfitobacter indolifex HEL-45]UOA19172.1 hypothetical protein DSM14862_01961 [Sulfitobacter indolifex]
MIVFAGPSLCDTDFLQGSALEIRPPVRQGDVYLATLEKPKAIGIIDGYFDGTPSVWHKEILWAISQGITVLGASSMGALRAAELDTFGMIGVGAIYVDYRDGILEGDDEVALAHGPAELGFTRLSVAMVNVRATLKAAVLANVLSRTEAGELAVRAKNIFFKDRTWESVLSETDTGLNDRENLKAWIAANEVDQKRIDAGFLLERMITVGLETPDIDFHFERTDLWVHATRTWKSRQTKCNNADSGTYNLLGNNNFLS